MLDTSSDAEERYYDLLRRQKPEERGRTIVALCELTRRLTEAGIRLQHPQISESELRARVVVRLYGRHIAKRLVRLHSDRCLLIPLVSC